MIRALLVENNKKKKIKISEESVTVEHSKFVSISKSLGKFVNQKQKNLDPTNTDLGGMNKTFINSLGRIGFNMSGVGKVRLAPLSIGTSQTQDIENKDMVINSDNKMIPFILVSDQGTNNYMPLGNDKAVVVFFPVPFYENLSDLSGGIEQFHKYFYGETENDMYIGEYNYIPFLYVPYNEIKNLLNFLKNGSGSITSITSQQNSLRESKEYSLFSIFQNVIAEGNQLNETDGGVANPNVGGPPINTNVQGAQAKADAVSSTQSSSGTTQTPAADPKKLIADAFENGQVIQFLYKEPGKTDPFYLLKFNSEMVTIYPNGNMFRLPTDIFFDQPKNLSILLNIVVANPEFSFKIINKNEDALFDNNDLDKIKQIGANESIRDDMMDAITSILTGTDAKSSIASDEDEDSGNTIDDEDVEELGDEDVVSGEDEGEDADVTQDDEVVELGDEDVVELKKTFEKIEQAKAIAKNKLVNASKHGLKASDSFDKYLKSFIAEMAGKNDEDEQAQITYKDFIGKAIGSKSFSNAVRHDVFYNDIVSSKEIRTLIDKLAENPDEVNDEESKKQFANTLSALIFTAVEERIFGNNIFERKVLSNDLLLEKVSLRKVFTLSAFALSVAGLALTMPALSMPLGAITLINSWNDDKKYKQELKKYKDNPDAYIRDFIKSGNFVDKMIDTSLAVLIAKSDEADGSGLLTGDFSFLSNKGANTSNKQTFDQCKQNYNALDDEEKHKYKEAYGVAYDIISKNNYVSNNVFTHGNVRKVLNLLFFSSNNKYKLSEEALNIILLNNYTYSDMDSEAREEFLKNKKTQDIEKEITDKVKLAIENETNFRNNTISFVNQIVKRRSSKKAGFFSSQTKVREREFKVLTNDLLRNLSRAEDEADYRKIYANQNIANESRIYKRKLSDLLFENQQTTDQNQENVDNIMHTGATAAYVALGLLLSLKNAVQATGYTTWKITKVIPDFIRGAANPKIAAKNFASHGIDGIHKVFDIGQKKSVIFYYTNHSAYVGTPKSLSCIIVDAKTGVAKFVAHSPELIEKYAGTFLKKKGIIIDVKQGIATVAANAKSAVQVSLQSPVAQDAFTISANKLQGTIHVDSLLHPSSIEQLEKMKQVFTNTDLSEMGLGNADSGLQKLQTVVGKGQLQGLKQGAYEIKKSIVTVTETPAVNWNWLCLIPSAAAISHRLYRRFTKKQIDGGDFSRGFFEMYKPTTVIVSDFFFALLGINLVNSASQGQPPSFTENTFIDENSFENIDDGENDQGPAIGDKIDNIEVDDKNEPSLENPRLEDHYRRRYGKNLSISDLLSESKELSDMWNDYWKRN